MAAHLCSRKEVINSIAWVQIKCGELQGVYSILNRLFNRKRKNRKKNGCFNKEFSKTVVNLLHKCKIGSLRSISNFFVKYKGKNLGKKY